MEDIDNMEFYSISNNFNKNYAINGGAFYLKENKVSNGTKTLIIEDNDFNDNIAEDFGGALYFHFSELNMDNSKNNIITHNKAGINGGGIYTENFAVKNISNEDIIQLKDNLVDSTKNEYSSNPSYITLNPTLQKELDHYSINIYSGEYISLRFTLYDEYNQIFNDTTHFYPISLKVVLISNDNYYKRSHYINNRNLDSDSKSTSLSGNICFFINGNI